jgi:hypothetical protein
MVATRGLPTEFRPVPAIIDLDKREGVGNKLTGRAQKTSGASGVT